MQTNDDFVGGTVLLVDDEKDIREYVFHALQHAGYAVVQASSGTEALSRFAHFSQDIDLLVTDLVMPGLQGDQLAARLLEQKPELKVIFISGNIKQAMNTVIPLEEGVNYLRKPFGLSELENLVESVLASDRATNG